jgi:hypothetical protein
VGPIFTGRVGQVSLTKALNGHSVSLDSVSLQFQALSMLLLSDHRPYVSKIAQSLAALQTDTIFNSSDEGFFLREHITLPRRYCFGRAYL